jgi:hypothetical protein
MTAPTIPTVTVEPGSRLDDLLALYDQLKAQADEAEQRFETVKNAVKAELAAAAPGAPQVDVAHPALAQPLRLSYVEAWRLDAKRMKAEAPELYVTYAAKSGSWQLRGVKP